MKFENLNLEYKGKKFSVKAKICSEFGKTKGLMFVRRKKAESLLFGFKEPVDMAIHSFFVFFPFLAIWLNEKNEIIEFQIVKPFESYVLPKVKYYKLIEIPFNEKYLNIKKIFE
jgi:uncharacterized membrane protein (UPF0127 family)